MKDILIILDDLASVEGKYTTMKEVLEHFYGEKVDKAYVKEDYDRLKQILYRNKSILEYKNGIDASEGFRYKRGNEYFFARRKEEKLIKQKKGDDRQLFLTGGLQMLLDGKTSTYPLIELECVKELKNLKLVKVISRYLGKIVISFCYNQGFENKKTIIMHPHILKEYNSRWFLFGYVDNKDELEVVCFSLDRITNRVITPLLDIPFIKAPANYYKKYFKDIIGTTRLNGEVMTITLRTTSHIVHNLLLTKPLHSSQKEIKTFDKTKGYGEISLCVIPNIELRTKILSFGSGIVVTGNNKFREQIIQEISLMQENYNK